MITLKEKSGIFDIIFASFFTTLVLFISLIVFPVFTTYAQTVAEEDVNNQITALKEKIQQLQIQIMEVQSDEPVLTPVSESSSTLTTVGYKFTHNLKIGDREEGVRQLQIILNSDPETMVAKTGAGSAGNETTYFGSLTKAAVIKFQNKYDSEVLTPLGLRIGTGYVGFSTIAKLDEVSTALSAVSISTTPTLKTPINSIIQSDELVVMYPSQYSGSVGTELVLFGLGFKESENHVIHFGNEYAIQDTAVLNSGALEFTIPDDIALGKYSIWVTNGKEKSNDDVFFIVTNPLVPGPVIESMSSVLVRFNEEITIVGSGFTSVGNNIRAGYGVIEDIPSSDGKTLTFKITPDVFKNAPNSNTQFEFWVYVENKNGISNSARFSYSLAEQFSPVKILFKIIKQTIFNSKYAYAQEPPPPPECSDLIDNDNDGLVDFPLDFSCSSELDESESGGFTLPLPPGLPELPGLPGGGGGGSGGGGGGGSGGGGGGGSGGGGFGGGGGGSGGGAGVSFGGMITAVTYCTCNFNILLTIGPPAGGVFVYQTGASMTYMYGQVYRPGPWTLGLYTPGAGICMMYAGVTCTQYPSTGMITMIGTSL